MKMTKDETSLSSDFFNLIPDYRRRDIESILNDTRISWDERRNRVNNYLKTYIPYDTMKTYSKLLSNQLERDMQKKFEETKTLMSKIFGESSNLARFKENLFPSFRFDLLEKDISNFPGKKYIRNEVYTGPYDKSIIQRIDSNFPDRSGAFSFGRRMSKLPIGRFNRINYPYKYCIPIC